MRAIGRVVQPNVLDPVANQAGILSRADVGGAADPAGEYEILNAATALVQPRDQALSRLLGEFKLHRFSSFLLDDRSPVPSGGVDDELANAQSY